MPLRKKSGFTLMELMVAMCCASILVLVAWNTFGSYQRVIAKYICNYDRQFTDHLHQLQAITKNARDSRERSPNRF